jgi:hypothetical protein
MLGINVKQNITSTIMVERFPNRRIMKIQFANTPEGTFSGDAVSGFCEPGTPSGVFY